MAKTTDLARQGGPQAIAREVDLHGLEVPGQTDPDVAIRRLLQDDRIAPEQLAKDLEGLAAQWRGHIAGKFLILLLDDARDEKQVEPFLPGAPGYVVFVTSRRPLANLVATIGAIPRDLEVLSPAEAAELAMKIVGRAVPEDDRQTIEQIVEACGRLPQAIAMTMAPVPLQPHLPLTSVLRELKERPNRLLVIDKYANGDSEGLARAFERSYVQLPAESQVVLRKLGLSPVSSISAQVSAALSNLPVERVRDHLGRLRAERLIEQDGEKYRLHDLIREYARSLAGDDDPEESAAAVNRTLAYYHEAAAYVDATLTRQPPPVAMKPPVSAIRHQFADRRSAIAWARDEWPNLLSCADHAAHEAGGVGHEQEKAWVVMFASALAGLLRNDGLWPKSIELQTRAIAAAEQLGHPLAKANALHERGQLHRLSGDLGEAMADVLQALALYRDIGGSAGETGEAHALNTYGVVLDQLKKPAEAREQLSLSLAQYRRLGNRLGEANALHDQGMAEYFAKDYARAVDLLSQALVLYQKVDQLLGQAHAHANLARAQRGVGSDREAAGNLAAARVLYRELGNQLGEATTRTQLGAVLREQQDYRGAEAELGKAAQLNEEIGNQRGLANALREWSALRGDMGDLAGAKVRLMRSLQLFRAYGLRRDEDGPLDALKALGLWDGAPAWRRMALRTRARLAGFTRRLSAVARKTSVPSR